MNDKIEEVLKQPWTIPAVIGVLSFGGGLGVGYILGKRKNQQPDVHEVPEQMLLDFTDEEQTIHIVRDTETTPASVRPPKVVISEEAAVHKNILTVNDLSQLSPSMLGQEEVDVEIEEETVEFETVEDAVIIPEVTNEVEWDYEEEIKHRTTSAPYILHQEEFFADEKNYTQTTLTYYAVDNIMADEDEKPVYNHTNVTGPLRFGHGSGDPNVVYIRNDERRAEYEVVKLDALYSMEVLGLEIENNERVADLKHSRNTKFRMD